MNRIYKPLLIWVLAFALLLGASYNLYLSYDYKTNPDCITYLSISNSEFNNQNLVRKYRVLVPYAAKIVSLPIQKIYYRLWTNRSANDDGPIRLGFFIVNIVLMSFVGLMIYYIGKAYYLSDKICFAIIVAVLIGGRWGTLLTAMPVTDSLYMLIICAVLYAIKTDKNSILIPCLVLGTISKEAFLMLIPFIFIFSSMPKLKLGFWIIFGLLLTWSVRHYIDSISTNFDMMSSVNTDLDTIYNVVDSIKRVCSFRGIGELFTLFGVFTFILLIGFLGGKSAITTWICKTDRLLWFLLPIALAHALLSTEVSRMIYLFSAPLAIFMGLIIQNHPVFIKLKSVLKI